MPAYLIVDTDIHDPEQYERYKEASPGAVAAGHDLHSARPGSPVPRQPVRPLSAQPIV